MDTMTHPDFRGRGVFVALARACIEIAAARGIRVLYGFPNDQSYPGFVRRLEWGDTGGIPHWIRPIRPSRHPKLSKGPGAILGHVADGIAALWPMGERDAHHVKVTPCGDQGASGLLRELGADDLWRVDRTPEWLAWRYSAAAAQGYERIEILNGDSIRAAAVWGMRDDSWGANKDGRAHLVELSGSDPLTCSAALAQVIRRAKSQGAWLLETVTNRSKLIQALRRAGFVSHRAASLIVRTLGSMDGLPESRNSDRWCIMGGDLDTF
jgi:GNAT superfamily N-acetyltransferase